MSLATIDVEPVRSARRAPFAADSVELVAHLGMRMSSPVAMLDAPGGETCEFGGETRAPGGETCEVGGETCTVESVVPSGAGEPVGIAMDVPPFGVSWSRRGWKSTAAFTIGRPPRAPRAG